MHLLLIEPDRLTAEAIIDFLQSNGNTIKWAQGAEQAIAAIDNQVPGVVITELALGAHSGIEFLHEFKSYAEWSDIPIIVFTVDYFAGPANLLKLGASAYLYKPKTPLTLLLQTINNLTTK